MYFPLNTEPACFGGKSLIVLPQKDSPHWPHDEIEKMLCLFRPTRCPTVSDMGSQNANRTLVKRRQFHQAAQFNGIQSPGTVFDLLRTYA